jgi:uncharacterized protein DUF5946
MSVMTNRSSEIKKYYELSYYTLGHADPEFIHQHIVDAFAAQTANGDTKPITLALALIGLYLYLEKGYTGKQVQMAHTSLARRTEEYPTFDLPEDRGEISVADVLSKAAGEERDAMIRTWCASVWQAYRDFHTEVRLLCAKFLSDY